MSFHVLAIHAHPDDVEILAAGTLGRLASLGHRITVATMTPGDVGTAEYGPEEIAAIRRAEAMKAAALLGAAYSCLEFRDLAIFNDDASRRRVTEFLRQAQPDVVITASPVDYHCDHEAASNLVRDACFAAPAPNYQSGPAAAMRQIPALYFMDPAEGHDRDGKLVTPDFVVDVTEQLSLKRDMLACHQSQRAWLKKHHGMDDYIQIMEQWTQARGTLAGISFGEGFRQYRCHPYPLEPVLQKALGGSVRVL